MESIFEYILWLGAFTIGTFLLFATAPLEPLLKRLIFLALGVALLGGLNEMSKLGLSLKAPPLQ